MRDAYELELLHEFMEARKPVLGICRGMQLINVALGGTLYQDLPSQRPGAVAHESEEYDRNIHTVTFTADGELRRWFKNAVGGRVVSIHHQGINRPGRDVSIEATAEDGEVEAIRWKGRSFVCGVQWHPEFHQRPEGELLDCNPLLEAFLAAAKALFGHLAAPTLNTGLQRKNGAECGVEHRSNGDLAACSVPTFRSPACSSR